MRLLLDSCVAASVRDRLREAGHDAEWVGDWEKDPGDLEILAKADQDARILVTLDKDFGELAIVHGEAHRGIIRLVGLSVRSHADAILKVLQSYSSELAQSPVVTVEPGRVRIRAPDSMP